MASVAPASCSPGRPRAGAAVGAGAESPFGDSPFAWYLSRLKAKIAERWAGKALPGPHPVAVFEISREGQVSRLAIEKSSGNTDYDQAALRAITEANPFPPLPSAFRAATLPVKMDFAFREAEEERRRKENQAEQERDRLEQERLRQAEERRRQEIAAKPWPDQIKQAALDKSVRIGMTREHVTAAWGPPARINETIRATSRDEQWIYSSGSTLYFTNGALTTIRRTR